MSKDNTLTCPICASQMQVTFHGDHMDKKAVCPACGHTMDVPDSFQRTKVTKTTRKSLFGSTTVEEIVAEERSDFDRNAAPSSPRTKSAPPPPPKPQATFASTTHQPQMITVDMSKMATPQSKGASSLGCWVFALIFSVFIGANLIFTGGAKDIWNSIQNVASGGTEELENARPVSLPAEFIAMTFSPDGSVLVASDEESNVYFMDASDYRVLTQFAENPYDAVVTALTFNTDGTLFATGNAQGIVRIWATDTFQPLYYLTEGYGSVNRVEFSSDGQYILAQVGSDKVYVWEMGSGKLKNTLNTDRISSAALQPTGTMLAVGSDKSLFFWDISTGKIDQIYSQKASVESLDFSPDGRYLTYISSSQVMILDSKNKWKNLRVLEEKNDVFGPNTVRFSPGGRYVAVGDFFSKTYVWEVESGNLKVKATELNEPELLAFTPDGKSLITLGSVSNDAPILRVWDNIFEGDKVDGQVLETTAPLAENLPTNAFKAPQERTEPSQTLLLEIDSADHVIQLSETILVAPRSNEGFYWLDSTTGEIEGRLTLPNNDYVNKLVVSPDETLIAVGPYRNSIHIVDAKKMQLIKSLKTNTERGVEEITFSADNSLLVTLDEVANITVWDTATWQQRLTIDQDTTTYTYDLSISPDNQYIATSYSEDNIVFIYDVETGALVKSLTHPNSLFRYVEFTPDGRYLLASNSDGVLVLDVENDWQPIANMDNYLNSSLDQVTLSPDGTHMITTTSFDANIFVWNLENFRLEWILTDGDDVVDVATNADGSRLISVGGTYDPSFNTGMGNKMRVWDLGQ